MNEGILSEHPHVMYWFIALVVSLISIDLLVLRRKEEKPTMRSSIMWTTTWFAVAMLFNLWIGLYLGWQHAATFFTGYVIEMSLSVDNLFVFILIFTSFKIDSRYQHRVLFWGILGALVMRAICIAVGVTALRRFEWLEFVFAAILIWAGIKSFRKNDTDEPDPTKGAIARGVRRFLPIHNEYKGDRFFVRVNGVMHATPLFLVLLLVEASDVIFAVDSIPAVLSITQDPFLVYSSNIFAILGLRSLYFVLEGLMHHFRYLGTGVSCILVFIGIKMGISRWYHLPTLVTLGVILAFLGGSIVASLLAQRKEAA